MAALNPIFAAIIASNPALQGFSGFGLTAALTSFAGDVNNNYYRNLMKSLGMAPVAATQLGLQTGEILALAKGAAFRLDQLSAELQLLSPASAEKSIAALEAGMANVTKAAVLLKAADLSEEHEELDKIFIECEKGFAAATRIAEDGLKAISSLHSQIVELHSTRLTPLDERIKTLGESFPSDLQRTTSRYREAKEQAAIQERAASTMEQGVASIQRRVDENKTNSQASDIVFDIFTLGIGRAIDGAPPDPFGFRDQLRNAQNELRSAYDARTKAQNIAQVHRFQMGQVREQLMYMEALQGDIPKLIARLNRAKDASVTVQKQFASIKDGISTLSREIGAIRNTAANTRDLAVVQEEFANGLLTICQQALIDPRLLDEVKTVTDVIDNGFQLADLPKGTRKEIDRLVADMSKRVSITDITSGAVGPLGIPLTKRARKQLTQTVISPIDKLSIGPLGLPAVIRAHA